MRIAAAGIFALSPGRSAIILGDGIETQFDYLLSEIRNKTGRTATDITILYDRVVFGGKSDIFGNPPHIDAKNPKNVTYDGGNAADKVIVNVLTLFDPADNAKKTSVIAADWSFNQEPKSVPIPLPNVETKDHKFVSKSLDGSFDIFNDDIVLPFEFRAEPR